MGGLLLALLIITLRHLPLARPSMRVPLQV